MSRFDGSLARTLDFGETTTTASVRAASRAGLRLALPDGILRGPTKYLLLERRRREAQMNARRMLDLIDVMERAGERR